LFGEYAERPAAQNRMLALAIGAAVSIFLLLHLAFGSWRLAAVCFMALRNALVGGVIAAFVGGGTISLGSLVGFLTALGIAARNGIMLILHYQHVENHEDEVFGPGLILRGARERLPPILMTAAATGLALVWAGNIPGHEIEHPDGHRHPGWTGHVDAAQPVSGAHAVPARRPGVGGCAATSSIRCTRGDPGMKTHVLASDVGSTHATISSSLPAVGLRGLTQLEAPFLLANARRSAWRLAK
jgi:hypothetical protein